jgi:hypothetical protein
VSRLASDIGTSDYLNVPVTPSLASQLPQGKGLAFFQGFY